MSRNADEDVFIPVSIDQLINENIVEWARIEFKEEWDPNSTLKTISAFANHIDNWGNGYIVFFIKSYKKIFEHGSS